MGNTIGLRWREALYNRMIRIKGLTKAKKWTKIKV